MPCHSSTEGHESNLIICYYYREVVLFTSNHLTEAEWIEWTDRYMHNQTTPQQGLTKAHHACGNVPIVRHMIHSGCILSLMYLYPTLPATQEKVAATLNQLQQVVEGRIIVASSPYIDHNELQAAVEELGKHMQFDVEEGTDGRTDTFSEEGLDPNDIDFTSRSYVRTSPPFSDTIYTQRDGVSEEPSAGTEKGSPGTSGVPCPTSSLPPPTTADDTGFFERNEDTRTDLSAPSASTPIAEPAEAESQDTLVLGILQQDKRIVETPSFNLHPSRSSPTSPGSGEDIACVNTRTERFTGSSTASSSGFSQGETEPPLAAPSSRSSPSTSQAFVQPVDASPDVISASTSVRRVFCSASQ